MIWAVAAELLIASNAAASEPCDAKSSFFKTHLAGALADCGTVGGMDAANERMDGFTACPASGEDTARSTDQAFDCIKMR
ncbi:hypothetical protein M0D45_09390 [Xanthomonas prunicola]|nr:hypothetical protein [Xanthomonas prunicola]UXA54892.1 hypothetical protein M0D45_09390 [Xanthomonas prunicola]